MALLSKVFLPSAVVVPSRGGVVQQSRIIKLPNYVRVEVRGGAADVLEDFQQAAVTCVHKRRVLLTSLDYQGLEVHEAVRSMIRMVALAGDAAVGTRIALITRLATTAAAYASLPAFARGTPVEIRLFDTEKEALEWLET
jgi:hypothetical protein